jgi:hypothetical protein
MTALKSKADRPATGNILLTTGLGIIFGLLLALPPALAVRSSGLGWFPFGFATLLPGMVSANLLAYLVVRFVFGARLPEPLRPLRLRMNIDSPTSQRLADAVGQLQQLERERVRCRDRRYGRRAEERIIWNELLDLELQEIDEQMQRICKSNPPKRSLS